MQEGKEERKIKRERDIKLELKGIKTGNKNNSKSSYYLLGVRTNNRQQRRYTTLRGFVEHTGPFISVGPPDGDTIGAREGSPMMGQDPGSADAGIRYRGYPGNMVSGIPG